METGSMAGHVVLITGALTGIGRATAIAFAREGARLVISGRRDGEGKNLANQLGSLGTEAEYFRADVRQDDDVHSLIEFAIDRFGELDVAVNSAGSGGRTGTLEQSADSYATTFETNVLGMILSLKHELGVMKRRRRGSIINLSSTMGHKAAPGMSLYAASKHAVEGLTKSAALEAAPFCVRVNAVAPGATETATFRHRASDPKRRDALIATVPLGRFGTAEEVANAIVFLASDRASFISGQVLSVDGGESAT